MSIEGTVQLSIKDFDEFRTKAKWFEQLRSELKACSTVEVKEISDDEFIQIISVDAEKIKKIAADYSEVEEIFDDDVIQLVNSEKHHFKNEIQIILDSPLTDFNDLHEAIQDILNKE